MRGVRVQAVVQELQGERIDIIPWSAEPATFIVNALAPAEVSKVVLDEDTHRVEVVVPDEQLSLAIGRRGQNVRLASQLTGWQIDILTEAEESERRQKEFAERTKLFMEALDVDETVAQLLASEGFATIEDVAYVPLNELAAVEGFDEETAQELQSRALEFIEAKQQGDGRQAPRAGRRRRSARGRRRHAGDGGRARRSRHQDARRSRGLRHRRSARLLRGQQGQGARARSGRARRLQPDRRRRQRHHHEGARQDGLDRRSRVVEEAAEEEATEEGAE